MFVGCAPFRSLRVFVFCVQYATLYIVYIDINIVLLFLCIVRKLFGAWFVAINNIPSLCFQTTNKHERTTPPGLLQVLYQVGIIYHCNSESF